MARGATEFTSVEDWVSHKTRSGGNSAFLKGWKEKPGHIDTWMHVSRLPMAVWQHPFPMPTVLKDKKNNNEEVKHIFSKKFTCHETEKVLKAPWRDKETGARENPPERCGICKFADWLWIEILQWVQSHRWVEDEEDKRKGKWVAKEKGKGVGIDPTMRIFNFVSDADAKENVRITAGGFCGYLQQKTENLDWGVKKAMSAAGIRGDEVWKEVAGAKCSYAMTIVNNDSVDDGLRIAVETQALGEAVKTVITDTMKSQEVNIQKEPYCIQWEYFSNEEFSKKYKATPLMKKKPSPRILKLIRGEAPDLTELKTPFDQKKMAALFEKNCLIKEVPWDEIFPSDAQIEKWKKEDAAEDAEDQAAARKSSKEDEEEEESPDSEEEEESEEDDVEEDEKSEDEDDDMVACDNKKCGKPMKLSASECPHCHKKYDVEEEPESAKEEKKLPTRAEVAARKATEAKKVEAAPKASAKEKKSSKKKDEDDDEEEVDADAEIPF